MVENKKCDCVNCDCGGTHKTEKAIKIKIALLIGVGVGVAIGAVIGAKYHKELTETALDSWSSAQKKSKQYAHLSDKQLKRLKKDLKKKLSK